MPDDVQAKRCILFGGLRMVYERRRCQCISYGFTNYHEQTIEVTFYKRNGGSIMEVFHVTIRKLFNGGGLICSCNYYRKDVFDIKEKIYKDHPDVRNNSLYNINIDIER